MAKPNKKVDKDLCRVITPEFRVSYPHLFKPQQVKPTDKPKFSITMLFPKEAGTIGQAPGVGPDGVPVKRGLKECIKNAKIAAYGPDKENWPELDNPIADGNDAKYADKEGYKGHWIIKATTSEEQRPSVVDRDMTPITEAAVLYPGCYARAYIFARVWEHDMGGKGVQFILDHVQKLREGKMFGGKKPVEQIFSPFAALEEDDEDSDDDDEKGFK